MLIALQGRRVDVSGMVAVGYGEADPIADNGTEEGREANRRIAFTLIGDDPADDGEAVPNATAGAAPAAAAGGTDGSPDALPPDAEPADALPPDAVPPDAVPPDAPPVTEPPAAPDAAAGPDFSADTSPSVAPTEKTRRPKPRPARQD